MTKLQGVTAGLLGSFTLLAKLSEVAVGSELLVQSVLETKLPSALADGALRTLTRH